jgi:hypothetical protein
MPYKGRRTVLSALGGNGGDGGNLNDRVEEMEAAAKIERRRQAGNVRNRTRPIFCVFPYFPKRQLTVAGRGAERRGEISRIRQEKRKK